MPHPSVPVCRLFSPAAPTVRMFLAVEGVETVFDPGAGVARREEDHVLLVAAGARSAHRATRKSYSWEFES